MNIATNLRRANPTATRTDSTSTARVQGTKGEGAHILNPRSQTFNDFHQTPTHLALEALRLGKYVLGRFVDAAFDVADRTVTHATGASKVTTVPDTIVVCASGGLGIAGGEYFDVGVCVSAGEFDLSIVIDLIHSACVDTYSVVQRTVIGKVGEGWRAV